MATTWGTSYFVSKRAAVTYYRPYHYPNTVETVNRKLTEGEIHIGVPVLKDGEHLSVIDGGTKYAITKVGE